MTSAPLKAVLALAAALPSAAFAFQWSGRAGFGYMQEDASRPGAAAITTPRLDVDVSLDASGFVYQRDALSWSGGASYRRLSLGVRAAPDEVQNQLEYRLRTSIFPRRNSPLTLSAFAFRADGDGTGGAGSYGATTTSFGADLAIRIPDRPGLNLGYTRTDGTRTGGVLPDTRTARDQFSASTAHSTQLYSYVAAYRGAASEGTYASENFDDHRVDMNARVRLARNTGLQMADTFYRRTPTLDSRFNPRQDSNVFSATLRHDVPPGAALESHSVTYSHSSGVTDAADTAVQSRAAQQLDYVMERAVHGPQWVLVSRVGANLDERSLAEVRERTAGQTLGATLSWRKAQADSNVQVFGGPSVGLLEPFDGSVEVGYGGTAGAALQRRWEALTGSAQYAISYGFEGRHRGHDAVTAGLRQCGRPRRHGRPSRTSSPRWRPHERSAARHASEPVADRPWRVCAAKLVAVRRLEPPGRGRGSAPQPADRRRDFSRAGVRRAHALHRRRCDGLHCEARGGRQRPDDELRVP